MPFVENSKQTSNVMCCPFLLMNLLYNNVKSKVNLMYRDRKHGLHKGNPPSSSDHCFPSRSLNLIQNSICSDFLESE